MKSLLNQCYTWKQGISWHKECELPLHDTDRRPYQFPFSINSKTWSDYILLSLKHPDRCCWGKEEKLLCNCLPGLSNRHRNLPFFCTDSWASIFLPKQLIKSIQLMEKQSYKQLFKNNLILWVILRSSPASLILPMSSTCSFATFKNQQRF